jgi:MFS family permease
MEAATMAPGKTTRWLNGTVAGIALASLLSDASHEMASAALPAFLASMGVAAAWLGAIEGISDGISSFAKLLSGHWTDGLARRKKILVLGYAVTALGTASFGFATSAWHVLTARSTAWLGRGVRSPVKKAMLAAAVTPETYGRAFGFERMMDTCGALVGPAAALALLGVLDHDYRTLFFLTLIPGLAATAVVAGLVRERERRKVKSVSFREGLGQLPPRFRRFLLAVGVFGAGDFSHTLLILYATGKLAPTLGTGVAASAAVGLYLARNLCHASFSFFVGWLSDRVDRRLLLGSTYLLAFITMLLLILLPPTLWSLALVFILAGLFVAGEETLEDTLAAELVPAESHGMAFGILATVNGAGDFVSSLTVGLIWTAFGSGAAFGFSAILFAAGALLVFRLAGTRDAA